MTISRLAVFLTFLAICYGEDNACNGRADGWVAEIGCWGYAKCEGGKLVNQTCPPQEVYDRDSGNCVAIGTNSTDCGKAAICSGTDDGPYGDIGCKSYYVCSRGNNVGRIYCPANLVYDSELKSCNYPSNTHPPCGTATKKTKVPSEEA